MCKGFGIYVALALCLLGTRAAIIPLPEELALETTTASEDASTTVEPELSTTPSVAQSRDQDASVQVEWASVDPAPGTVDGDLSVPQVKLARLLLLSTPGKRPAEVEQQLEEQDENESADAGSGEQSLPTTTTTSKVQEEVEEVSTTTEHSESTTTGTTTTTTATTTESSDQKTTKLFAINATTSSPDSTAPNVAVAVANDNATIAFAAQPQAAGDNNVAVELALVEPEAEYVLLDGGDLELGVAPTTHDELQLGSFTHIDSDLHLQPVVHSIEIVPTSFDDPLIVNYVHNLR